MMQRAGEDVVRHNNVGIFVENLIPNIKNAFNLTYDGRHKCCRLRIGDHPRGWMTLIVEL